MKNLNKNNVKGLKGGPNENSYSVTGYKADSPDRFNSVNIIPSGRITMQDVPHPVMGIDNMGNQQMMVPGMEYQFPGTEVTEYPMMQKKCGGQHSVKSFQKMMRKQFGGDSVAPQNNNIDEVGATKLNTMRNHLAKNTINAMIDEQSAEYYNQFMQQGGSTYNPDMNYAGMYENAALDGREQLGNDFRNFTNAAQEVGQSFVNSQPQQTPESMYSFQNPNQAVPSFYNEEFTSPASEQFNYQKGGAHQLPKAQYGPPAQFAPKPLTQEQLDAAQQNQLYIPYNAQNSKLFGDIGTNDSFDWNAWNAKQQQYAASIQEFGIDPQGGVGQSIYNSGMIPYENNAVQPYMIPQAVEPAAPTIGSTGVVYRDPVTGKVIDKSTIVAPPGYSEGDYVNPNDPTRNTKKSKGTQDKKVTSAERASSNTQPSAIIKNTNEKRKGNYKAKVIPGVGENKMPTGNNNNQFLQPGQARGKFKMKYTDPETGKRVKIKFNTATGPRDYGNGRRGPRVVKYDIYNNPMFAQQEQTQSRQNVQDGLPTAPPQFSDVPRGYVVPETLPNQGVSVQGLESNPIWDAEQLQFGGNFIEMQFGGQNDYSFGNNYDHSFGQKAPETGESPYTMQDMGDRMGQAKWKNKNDNFNQFAPMILPAVDMISSFAEQGDARRNEEQLDNLKKSNAVFTNNTVMNRGKHTTNQGYFDPYNMTPVQFTGNNQGSIGGMEQFAQQGGNIQYQDGGEYYLGDDEIKAIMQAGGQIEYL